VAPTEDDGVADATEVGIEGVLVQLLDDTGAVIAETVTDAAGNYWFDSLRGGDYQVGIPLDQTADLAAQPGIVPTALTGIRSSTGQSAAAEVADDVDDGDPDLAGGWASVSDLFTLDHTTEAIDEAGDFGTGVGAEAEAAIGWATWCGKTSTMTALPIRVSLVSPVCLCSCWTTRVRW